MKKVLIIPSNTDLNRGDQALVWESARLAKSTYGDETEITLMDSGDENQVHQTRSLNYNMISPILKHPSRIYKNKRIGYDILTIFLWGCCAIFDWFKTQLLLSNCVLLNKFGKLLLDSKEKHTLEYFKTCDVLFVKGGGFLHSYGSFTDVYLFYYYLFDLKLAIRYKKPVVVLPNSIGPLKNRLAKCLLENTLNKCALVYTRESVSQNFLETNTSIRSTLSLDLAFYQKSSNRDFSSYLIGKGVNLGHKNVVITVRPYRFPNEPNPKEKYACYLKSISSFIAYLQEKCYDVTLFAHTLGPSAHEDDSIAIDEILSLLMNKKGITCIKDQNLSCQDVQKIYSYYDCVIGTRFHSVIFALNSFVPTIAITYGGNKGLGIMKDLGMENFSIPIENVNVQSLIMMFTELISNKDCFIKRTETLLHNSLLERSNIINEIKNVSAKFDN